ncbi:hypothetical protein F5Y19DRAFT_474680 [Xylariaceae sp. FL1651]|nr:hypothetical protein F5Y19DRAFT_474680 [Xylariaceae sp. FL1651]
MDRRTFHTTDESENELRSLRRLAKRYGISFVRQEDEWPEAHRGFFGDIQKLGDKKFDTYCKEIDALSVEKPWARQIKARAEWLVNRAHDLASNIRPNESGWRLGLENDVLHRFLVEIACPKCRARLWRSEIETPGHVSMNSKWMQELEQRRQHRKPCQCPPESRPRDYYELGTSLLFDDRVEEVVVLDSALKDLPKKQIPDRIIGLKCTAEVEQLLAGLSGPIKTNSNALEYSPFKSETSPSIFPFLILEAKSDASKNGFQDIRTQTAFPIWRLLNLQRNLISAMGGAVEDSLVWFLGNRGSEWKVFGCYIDTNEGRTRYKIHPLWGGDLTTMNGALQLILIVDYIVDWARDTYRPFVLRALKSLSTGRDIDEVSVDLESCIPSATRNRVFEWLHQPSSRLDDEEDLGTTPEPQEPLNPTEEVDPELLTHRNLYSIKDIPNTTLGSIRSATQVNFHFNSLCILEENVESLLILSGGPNEALSASTLHARELDTLLHCCGPLLVISQHALDEVERMWTGQRRTYDSPFTTSSEIELYAILEYRCFLSTSWDIVRELTCLAVSKPAYEIIKEHTAPDKTYQITKLSNASRSCASTVLYEAIECLLSDSPSQILHSSISGTLMSISPETIKEGAQANPPIQVLEFENLDDSRIGHDVEKYSRYARRQVSKNTQPKSLLKKRKSDATRNKNRMPHREREEKIEAWHSLYRRKTANRSFAKESHRKIHVTDTSYHSYSCRRCEKRAVVKIPARKYSAFIHSINENGTVTKFGADWSPILAPPLTHNTMLVQAVQNKSEGTTRQELHSFCLFILGEGPKVDEGVSIGTIVEAYLHNDQVYHSRLRDPKSSKTKEPDEDVPWNSWDFYRPCTKAVLLKRWIEELNQRPV